LAKERKNKAKLLFFQMTIKFSAAVSIHGQFLQMNSSSSISFNILWLGSNSETPFV